MEKIKNSIVFYTVSSENCKLMKMLMDPIEFLDYFTRKSDEPNKFNNNILKLFGNFNETFVKSILQNEEYEKNKYQGFIKNEETFNKYINHIQNILIQAYINYYDKTKQFPTKLYRAITRKELDYLNNTRNITTFWSTTNNLEVAQGYIEEMAAREWDPQEWFILEFTTKGRIPFINVDEDAKTVFEPNEFILVPPFNIVNPKLIKDCGQNKLGLYFKNNIPIYSAKFKPNNINMEIVNFEDIKNKYRDIVKEIEIYGNLIETYINGKKELKIFNNQQYRTWAKKLQDLIKLQQQYIGYCIKNGIDIKTLDGEIHKIKKLI